MENFINLQIDAFDYSIKQDDLILVGDALLDSKRSLISHHLDSANQFYENGIKQIITQGFKIEREIYNRRVATDEDKEIERIFCEVIPIDIELRRPTTLNAISGKEVPLYPKVALAREKIYSGPLLISCNVRAVAYYKNGSTQERTDSIKSLRICKVPIIKGSKMCNTYEMTKEAMMHMGEDPSDPGGYFIVKGEWAVDCTENITYNQPKIYINEGYGKSLVRCEYISKPGDGYQNSDYIIVRYSKDNTLTIEIARDKLNTIPIPFFLLFRALGWTNDKEIFDWIIFDYDDVANQSVLNIIMGAMDAKYRKESYRYVYNQIDAVKAIIHMVPEEMYKNLDLKNKKENYQNAINDILRIFDTHCLPHIGLRAGSRYDKLKFLCLLIRKTILVHLRYIPQTDRDSYRNKRIHSAGENYTKAFKTYFNQTIVMPIKKQIIKHFQATPFSQVNLVNLVRSSIFAEDFERLIVQAIISGNRSELKVGKKILTNRLAAQQLNRKNQLNAIATMRQISATSSDSAKQSERASEMRRVHMSALGYICVVHSTPEGEKVGINKQMAMFASIASSSSSEVLRKLLLADPDIIAENTLSPKEIYTRELGRVYVNGFLIGYVAQSIALVEKYRAARRRLEVSSNTTIYWDNTQNEIQFFVDIGRITRPLIIVYNSQRDAGVVKLSGVSSASSAQGKRGKHEARSNTGSARGKRAGAASDFEQGIAINTDDITALFRRKTMDELVREQKVEFITPEEQENCFVCASFEQLERDRYDETRQYTHCDIPQAILGLTALTAPFGNHNHVPRVTYQTSQAKQTCGYYALNWCYRMDKETVLQYINEQPIIRTMANKYVFQNGVNVMVGICCYTGYNIEDSLIVNKAAKERGLFDSCKFTYYKTEFEQKEEMGNPDASKTDGLKAANYEKLVDGIVRKGMYIENDDVLIGRYAPLPKGKNKYAYVDRSIVYKDDERAIVHNVIIDQNEEDTKFAKVSLRKIRNIAIGDKFSSRAGQKGICALLMREADMPCTADGLRPALLFNSHGLPSRMTVSQLLESLIGNLCVIKGTHMDATMFKKVDVESIAEELASYGLNRYGYERMISGITGEYIDVEMFFGPTFYQRLQKFVADAEYSVRHALTDAVTYQPLEGISSAGGLRIGEMEEWVLCSHGVSRFLAEKFRQHSDGYVDYICRCGKPAIVNHRENIYKCKYCKDNADIVAIPTTWTSKLFIQEMESCNIGVKRIPRPFFFEKQDTKDRQLTRIDEYNKDSIKKLALLNIESVDDNGVQDADE